MSEGLDGLLSPIPDSALGHVEDPAHGDVIIRVRDRTKVGDGVPDLAALIEPHTAHHGVGKTDADEDLLERTGLRVGAIEDGDIRRSHTGIIDQRVDLISHEAGLVMLVVSDVGDDRGTRARIGPQPLGSPSAVDRDHAIGCIQDRLSGSVVLLKEHGLGIGIVALELLDVADGRPSKGVDGLVRITHHA